MSHTEPNPDAQPIASLNQSHLKPRAKEARMIAQSMRLAVKNTSRPPRSLKAFQEQFAQIQKSRQR
jgi:hypothetical protein